MNTAAPAGPSTDSSDLVVGWTKAYAEEREALGLTDAGTQPTALCLSGGGVRSAALCLGVIRSLADGDHRFLRDFHYLSTVSGGGYIGSWLTRFIADQPRSTRAISEIEKEVGRPASDGEAAPVRRLRRYTRFLAPQGGLLSLDTLAGVLLWMRNTLVNWFIFLPIFGALAALPLLYFASVAAFAGETGQVRPHILAGGLALVCLIWGGAASVLRLPSQYAPDPETVAVKPDAYGANSTQVFWMVALPFLIWCLLLPLMVASVVLPSSQGRHVHAVFGTRPVPTCSAGAAAPACPHADGGASFTASEREALRVVARTQRLCAAPAPGPAACRPPKRTRYPDWLDLWPIPALYLGACALAYLIAVAGASLRYYETIEHDGKTISFRRKHMTVLWRGSVPWLMGSLVSGLVLWWGIALARDAGLFWLAIVGPLWVALAEALRTTIYVALRHRKLRAELDREWLGRLNGTKLAIVLAGTAGGAVVVVGGAFLASLSGVALKALAGGGLASGGLVAWIGRSAATAFSTRAAGGTGSGFQLPMSALANLAVVVFGAVLFALIGHGVATLVGVLAVRVGGSPNPGLFLVTGLCLAFATVAACIAIGLGRAINLNRFSMHAVYRNRLIRAFLGSARGRDRRPDRYTGFDPTDNLRMADAFDREKGAARLFPVINVALNRTVGDDPARAERKADSFTITPLRCGSAALRLPSPSGAVRTTTETANLGEPSGAYVRSGVYAGDERQTGVLDQHRGISLGTAMTISGAAASPNMGYNSSPLVASVMTLFNVRLGAWLPNPGVVHDEKTLARSGPSNAVRALVSDLLGRSDITSPYIYLSDGGHFDNLGIYEMLRRRCGLILAIDAGQDQHYAYEDLTRTIEYARIDLGAEITFLRPIRVGDSKLGVDGAFAEIRYRTEDGKAQTGKTQTGRLVYLKSWLPPEAPVELLAMKARKASFPHETTLNQFFSESDFESYRRLGEYLMDDLIEQARKRGGGQTAAGSLQRGPAPIQTGLDHLFDGLERIARSLAASNRPSA